MESGILLSGEVYSKAEGLLKAFSVEWSRGKGTKETQIGEIRRTEGGGNGEAGVQLTSIFHHGKMNATLVDHRSSSKVNPVARSLWKETDRFKTSSWNTSPMKKLCY